MKKIILIVFSSLTLLLASCNGISSDTKGKKKYVIELSAENYEKYFDVNYSLRSSVHNTIITFSGCVSSAIYENCVVTYKYSLNSGDEPTYSESFELNMGGNGSIEAKGYTQIIYNVTGTVTYWN